MHIGMTHHMSDNAHYVSAAKPSQTFQRSNHLRLKIVREIQAIELAWEQPDLHVHRTQSRRTRSGTDIGIEANAIERNLAIRNVEPVNIGKLWLERPAESNVEADRRAVRQRSAGRLQLWIIRNLTEVVQWNARKHLVPTKTRAGTRHYRPSGQVDRDSALIDNTALESRPEAIHQSADASG